MKRKQTATTKARRGSRLPRGYLSNTQCKTYNECGLRYKALYIDEIETEDEYFLKRGAILHLALRAINIMAFEGTQTLAPEDARRAFRAAERMEVGSGFLTPIDVQEGIADLTKYALKADRFAGDMIDAEAKLTIDYSDDVKLMIIPDWIGNFEGDGLEVKDFKTGENILSKDELRSDYQLNIYGWAATKIVPGVTRVKLTHHMLKHGFEHSVIIDADELVYIKDYIDGVLEGIQSKKFEPRLNQYCHRCPIRKKCKVYKTRYIVNGEAIKNPEEAHAELSRVSSTWSNADARKKELRAYLGSLVDIKGSVPVEKGEREWVYRIKEDKIIDTTEMVRLFRKLKMNVLGYIEFGIGNFEHLKKILFRGLTEPEIADFKEKSAKLIKLQKSNSLVCIKSLSPKKPKKKKKG